MNPKIIRKAFLLSAVLTSIFALPAGAAPLTQFELQSQPGDYIGGGQSYFRDLTTGRFDIGQAYDTDRDGLADYVFFRYLGNQPGGFAHIFFSTAAMAGANLAPGFYPNAERGALPELGHPGMDWGMDGRGCNTLTGNFTILGAQFDYSSGTPTIVSFAATFEQHCEGATPALFGTFYYNYDPVPEPSTWALWGLGAAMTALIARRKAGK